MPVAKPTWDSEMGRQYRRVPVWPVPGIPEPWINKSHPDYQPSIFQGPETEVDPIGSIGGIKKIAKPTKRWFSKLTEALQSKYFRSKSEMKGTKILKDLGKHGVSSEELRWTGVQDFLSKAGHTNVNIADVRNLADKNKIKLIDRNLANQKAPKQLYDLGRKINEEKRDVIDRLGMYHRPYTTDKEFQRFLKDSDRVIRLDPIDQERAASEFRSRIDYINWSKKDALNKRAEFLLKDAMEDKVYGKIAKYEEKRQAYHYSTYLKDKPLPQGEDYQQWLVELKHGGTERSGGAHYPGQKNVVVGLAVDKRTTMEGKLGRHIHEYQSDWGLDIRRHGVEPKVDPIIEKKLEKLVVKQVDLELEAYKLDLKYTTAGKDARRIMKGLRNVLGYTKAQAFSDPDYLKYRKKRWAAYDAWSKKFDELEAVKSEITTIRETYPMKKAGQQPDMPYKDTDALKLGLKKALYEAAKEGVDVLTWSTGKHVAGRWGRGAESKWPQRLYDKFTPSTIVSLGKELGVKIRPREMKYPREHKECVIFWMIEIED
jgi:hypothetical protein